MEYILLGVVFVVCLYILYSIFIPITREFLPSIQFTQKPLIRNEGFASATGTTLDSREIIKNLVSLLRVVLPGSSP